MGFFATFSIDERVMVSRRRPQSIAFSVQNVLGTWLSALDFVPKPSLCAMPGTEGAYAGIGLRARHAMPSTEMAYGATRSSSSTLSASCEWGEGEELSLIHISEPTRPRLI
eukprot:106458-Rhodomonas_salina.2